MELGLSSSMQAWQAVVLLSSVPYPLLDLSSVGPREAPGVPVLEQLIVSNDRNRSANASIRLRHRSLSPIGSSTLAADVTSISSSDPVVSGTTSSAAASDT